MLHEIRKPIWANFNKNTLLWLINYHHFLSQISVSFSLMHPSQVGTPWLQYINSSIDSWFVYLEWFDIVLYGTMAIAQRKRFEQVHNTVIVTTDLSRSRRRGREVYWSLFTLCWRSHYLYDWKICARVLVFCTQLFLNGDLSTLCLYSLHNISLSNSQTWRYLWRRFFLLRYGNGIILYLGFADCKFVCI